MARRKRKPLKRSGKNTKKQNITYIFLLILLVIFFATVGIRLVINASLFISGIGNETIETLPGSDRSFLVAPEIYDVPIATNSGRINIAGSGTEGTTLSIFVNDAEVETINMDSDEFEVTLELDKGTNTIYLQTEDTENKRIKDSEIYTVIYTNEKPDFIIEEPVQGSTVDTSEITVQGSTQQDISIRINGSPTVLRADGSFQRIVRLKEGENTIIVTGEDAAGNVEEKQITIRYEN